MNRVKHIEIDLSTFKIALQFQNSKAPLILHFDTPSRKFYLSLIALIVHEMKQQDHTDYVYIRKHEDQFKFLDDALAETNASGTIDGMWEKIRKAWHYSLPNLEEAAHFKIEGRDVKPPYEKGGKYLYQCTEEECDIWASLFGVDDITNKWRFRFGFDEAWLELSDVTIKFGDLQDRSAWDAFLKHLEKAFTKNQTVTDNESARPVVKTNPIRWQLSAFAVVVMFVLLIGGAAILNRYLRPVPPMVESVEVVKPSIAILPFINVSDDPDKDYFCDGITEELINSLASVKDLRVISRTSAFYFKDKGFDLRTIGEKLGVDNVLEGSVRVSGDQLRISAQLIKVADDSHLWADTYDRKMIDIFDTQENLAKEIACSLKSQLGCKGNEVITKHYTNNFDAFNLFLKGRYLHSVYSFRKAIELFKKAIQIEPGYALAYTGLAKAYTHLGTMHGEDVSHYYLRAKEAAMKALEIDDMLSESHASVGLIKYRFEWDWDGAIESLKRAVELKPGDSQAHFFYSRILRAKGRFKEAMHEIRLAVALDPFSRLANNEYGSSLRIIGEIEQAILQYEKTLELFPDSPNLMLWLGMCYLDKGDFETAFNLIEKAMNHPKVWRPFALSFAGYAYGSVGRIEKAHEILGEVLKESKDKYFPPHLISLIYNGLGNEEKMFEYLEKAHKQKDPLQFSLKVIPMYKKYHSDPRFISLIERMGMEG